MLIFITGGAASGKSAYAETVVKKLFDRDGGTLVYLATMESESAEGQERIRRHREMRTGKGFVTVEKSTHLSSVKVPPKSAVLLECLTNLAANELFGRDGAGKNSFEEICNGLLCLKKQARHLVIVSGEVFSDGICYDPATVEYQKLLANLHGWIASRADFVQEIVCGLPAKVFHSPVGSSEKLDTGQTLPQRPEKSGI